MFGCQIRGGAATRASRWQWREVSARLRGATTHRLSRGQDPRHPTVLKFLSYRNYYVSANSGGKAPNLQHIGASLPVHQIMHIDGH
jgi:hypothetical protein